MTCSTLRDFFISTEGLAQTSRSRTTSKEEIWARFSRRATVECIIEHVRREERPELPEEALWEAVSNAVAHREYRSTASVQIYGFEYRIEVVSLGGLPAGRTEADLGGKRVPGNPLLFGMLYRVDVVENIGSGIRRIRDLCREQGGAEPTFDVSEYWLTVIFQRSAAPVDDQRARQAGSAADRWPESGPESGLESGVAGLESTGLGQESTESGLGSAGAGQESSESELGSLERRILALLVEEPLSMSAMAAALGHRSVSAGLNRAIHRLLQAGRIAYTVPAKPNSRLQKYRIAQAGQAMEEPPR